MIFYYNIIIVREARNDSQDLSIMHHSPKELDCNDPENRDTVVNHALATGDLESKDVKFVVDVIMTSALEYLEVRKYNRDREQMTFQKERQKIVDHLFESACGYGMAEGNGTQSHFDDQGNYTPVDINGTVAGGKVAFTKCINAIPEEYLLDFIYTLYRIADKRGEEGFSWE